jgi:outer membrane protein OmpA-like peptidoglycan-associated protein
MKKFVLFIAAIAMTASVSAQTVTESKTFDNFYIGINGGLATQTTHSSWMKNLRTNAGIRIGRNFTPVFGLALESNVYFNNKPLALTGTFVNSMISSVLGTVNLSNWFGGYKGEPRAFEVTAVYGFGWAHMFGNKNNYEGNTGAFPKNINAMTSKAGIDFAYNFGKSKAWQVYVEPSINYFLNGNGYEGIQYNINKSFVQLNAGVVYKFKNSNGTHNFTIATLRDQAEIDGLNAKINDLRNANSDKDAQLSAKDKTIADLQNQLNECMNKPAPKTAVANLQPTVIFRQGKSVIDPAQYASVSMIANYLKAHKDAKVKVSGYASPEGSKEINQKLSEARAAVVKDALVKKYKIAADRISTEGLGATDKLFDEVEFNRVATFNDETK